MLDVDGQQSETFDNTRLITIALGALFELSADGTERGAGSDLQLHRPNNFLRTVFGFGSDATIICAQRRRTTRASRAAR